MEKKSTRIEKATARRVEYRRRQKGARNGNELSFLFSKAFLDERAHSKAVIKTNYGGHCLAKNVGRKELLTDVCILKEGAPRFELERF